MTKKEQSPNDDQKEPKVQKKKLKISKADEYLEGWKRAQADYKNLQKQMEVERDTTRKYAKLSFIMNILPLYTNFGLASDHLPEELEGNSWAQGILHIRSQFTQILEDMGVHEIPVAVGDPFDHTKHEAVSQEQSEEAQSGSIIKVLARGFTLDGEVVLPVKVTVAE